LISDVGRQCFTEDEPPITSIISHGPHTDSTPSQQRPPTRTLHTVLCQSLPSIVIVRCYSAVRIEDEGLLGLLGEACSSRGRIVGGGGVVPGSRPLWPYDNSFFLRGTPKVESTTSDRPTVSLLTFLYFILTKL